ncbi:hypothetical protein QJQ45_014560 [Haematococcus lacustris]|nr:hypothetical protein QJQ45_014560 [Haematococcus lacustris]
MSASSGKGNNMSLLVNVQTCVAPPCPALPFPALPVGVWLCRLQVAAGVHKQQLQAAVNVLQCISSGSSNRL